MNQPEKPPPPPSQAVEPFQEGMIRIFEIGNSTPYLVNATQVVTIWDGFSDGTNFKGFQEPGYIPAVEVMLSTKTIFYVACSAKEVAAAMLACWDDEGQR